MKPHGILLLMMALLPLGACQDMVEGTQDISHTVKKDAVATAASVREIFSYRRKEPFTAIPYTFCYQVQADIVCYDRPLKGPQYRLVGWQGRPGPDGAVVANTILPDGVEPVEVTRIPASESDSITKANTPLTPLSPAFVNKPPGVKEQGGMVKMNDNPEGMLY